MNTDVHAARSRRARRRLGASLAAVAGLALAPAVAAAADADRGLIAYTDFDTIKAVGGAGGQPITLPAGAEPAWAPDGRHIAYFTGTPGGAYASVAVAGPDGSGARTVVRVDAGVVTTFTALGQPAGILTSLDLAGATDPERVSGLAWSPDGAQVRFAILFRSSAMLVGIDVTTGGVDVLRGFEFPRGAVPRDIAWSPAGRLVAFSAAVTRESDRRCRAGEHRVYTYRLRSEAVRRVAPRGRLCSGRRVDFRDPAFSPDGTHLVMTRFVQGPGAGSRSDLVTVHLGPRGRALSGLRQTAPGLRHVSQATFAPDGQRIAYTFLRPGPDRLGGLGVMRTDGTGRHDVVSAPFLLLQQPHWGYAARA